MTTPPLSIHETPPREPRWQHVQTDAGHHLRLVGGNGEPVLVSEVYEDPRSVLNALSVVRRSLASLTAGYAAAAAGTGSLVETVDERTPVVAPRIDAGPGHAADPHHNPGVRP